MFQREQFNSETSIHVWDLRPALRAWSSDKQHPADQVRLTACNILLSDPKGASFDEGEQQMFQIDDSVNECPAK
jgi:hypothetical protein